MRSRPEINAVPACFAIQLPILAPSRRCRFDRRLLQLLLLRPSSNSTARALTVSPTHALLREGAQVLLWPQHACCALYCVFPDRYLDQYEESRPCLLTLLLSRKKQVEGSVKQALTDKTQFFPALYS